MTLIDFGDFKLRFDSKEVRINIDGDLIDIGARMNDETTTTTTTTTNYKSAGLNFRINSDGTMDRIS